MIDSELPYRLPVYNRNRFAVAIYGWGFSLWSRPFSFCVYWRTNRHVWNAKSIIGYLPDEERAWRWIGNRIAGAEDRHA